MESIFDAVGGTPTLQRLAAAWHSRVIADELVAHAFARGVRPDHVQRLAAYWSEALGGPAAYTALGASESDVVRMHSGNGPHEEMNERAIACFDEAMSDAGVVDPRLRGALHDYFAWATNGPFYGYHDSADDVPDGLTLPRWSWDGPV